MVFSDHEKILFAIIQIIIVSIATAANVLPTPGSSAGYLYFTGAPSSSALPAQTCYVGMPQADIGTKCAIGDAVSESSSSATAVGLYGGQMGGVHVIVETNDQSSTIPYQCYSQSVGATSLTDGKTNTSKVYNKPCQLPNAADACYKKSPEGAWYLPAKDQLYEMYSRKGILGNFANEEYWSSTENTSNQDAWGLYLGSPRFQCNK